MGSSEPFLLNSTNNTYQAKDDYSVVKGRHEMKAGVEITERRHFYPSVNDDKGFFNFANVWTAACPLGNAACASAMSAGGITDPGGNGFADYLLGAAQQDVLNVSASDYAGYQRYYGFYAQDSWRVTPKLTLNYGLRYEYWSPGRFLATQSRLSIFRPVRSNTRFRIPLTIWIPQNVSEGVRR